MLDSFDQTMTEQEINDVLDMILKNNELITKLKGGL